VSWLVMSDETRETSETNERVMGGGEGSANMLRNCAAGLAGEGRNQRQMSQQRGALEGAMEASTQASMMHEGCTCACLELSADHADPPRQLGAREGAESGQAQREPVLRRSHLASSRPPRQYNHANST
jgi:hypothetical protein